MSNIRATQKDIIDYWYGKHILPDGRISDRIGNGIPILIDKGEINCWACDTPEECCKLERCHILAESLGGDGYADNLFLLCEDCHKESPDTTNREAFFRWVYKKRKKFAFGVPNAKNIRELIDEELSDRGMMNLENLFMTLPQHKQDKLAEMLSFKPDDVICANGDLPADSGLYQYVVQHTTIHFGEKCITIESMIIAFVDYILKCYYELILQDYNVAFAAAT